MRNKLTYLIAFILTISLVAAATPNPGHSASRIGNGTFSSGDYYFPGNVTIADNLTITDLNATRLVVTDASKQLSSYITAGNLWLSVNGVTGTAGSLVFSSSPTLATPIFTTNATVPLVIGGTAAGSTLTLKSTANGATTTDAIIFQVGNNGATEVARMAHNGSVGIGTVNPAAKLDVNGSIRGSSGLTITSGTVDLGVNQIQSSEIADSEIMEVDLNASNAASNGYVLIYNSTTGGFTWAIDQTGNANSAGGWTNTSTQVSLYNTANNVSANALFVDNTNGRVGVGTSTPSYPLHIYKTSGTLATVIETGESAAGSSAMLSFNSAAATNWSIIKWTGTTGNGGNLWFSTDGGTTPKVALQGSTGNVGINTSSPNGRLEINVPDVVGYQTILNLSQDSRQSWAFLKQQNQALYVRPKYSTAGQDAKFYFQNASGSSILVVDTETNRVGVGGTTSPAYPLDVLGAANVSGALYAGGAIIGYSTLTAAGITSSNGLTVSAGTVSLPTGEIQSSEIADSTIDEVDLNASNAASNGYVLVYNSTTGGFTWAADQTGNANSAGGWTNTSTQVSLYNSANNISANTLFVDNTNGRVGIGNSTPGYRLEVKSPATSTYFTSFAPSAGSAFIRVYQDGNSHLSIYGADASGTTNIVLNTNGVSYLKGGNVIIGGSADSGQTFQVSGTANVSGALYVGGAITGASTLTAAGITSSNGLTVSAGTVSLPTGQIQSSEIADSTIDEVDLNASNAAGNGQMLIYNSTTGGFTWATPTTGTMSNWILGASSGTSQTITNGDTVNITGGTGITATAGATDVVTIALNNTGVVSGTYGTGGLQKPLITVDAQGRITSASTTNIQNATTGGVYGVTTLINSTSSTSVTEAATPGSVKAAYDAAVARAAPGNCAAGQVVMNTTTSGVQCVAITSGTVTGSGTINYTARWITSSSIGTGALYDNGSNVGVGTTNPGSKLVVNGSAEILGASNGNSVLQLGQAATIDSVINGYDNLWFNVDSNNDQPSSQSAYHFGMDRSTTSGGSELMTILGTGNVGVNTTSPNSTLHVLGTGNVTGTLYVGGAITGASTLSAAGITSSNGLTVSAGTVSLPTGEIQSSEIADSTIDEVDLNASNAAANGQMLIYNSTTGGFTWATPSTGSMSSFILGASSGTSQTISNGDTINITAGTGITTTAGATDAVTIASTLGTAIEKGELSNSGSLAFSWNDTEVADTITVSGGTIGTNTISAGATWNTAGTLTIGDGGDRIDVNSSGWDITNSALNSLTGLTVASGTVSLPAGQIDSAEIGSAAINSTKLNASNSPSAGQLLAYNATTGGFYWTTDANSGNVTGSGTANYVATWGSTSGLTTGTLWQNTTHVGIGNSAPAYTLDVTGTGRFSGALVLGTQGTVSGQAIHAGRLVSTGNGLQGGGDLTADRTLSINATSCGATEYSYWNGTAWLCRADQNAGGSMSSFTLGASSGTSQTITDGNTLNITAGTGITTTAGATDAVTIASTLGTAIEKGELSNSGSLAFSWNDTEVADTLTVSGGTIGTNTISAGATWNTAGTLTIGDGGDRIDVNSSSWKVTNGAISGVTTLDTGQGAYELYAMNQNVRTTDVPTFAGLVLTSGAITNYSSVATYDNVAQYYNANVINTGTIVITIASTPNMMIDADIDVQGYNGVHHYHVRGYTQTGSTNWHQPVASCDGSGVGSCDVRFGNVTATGERVIMLGNNTTSWGGYPHVIVRRVTRGYPASGGIGSWSINMITDESAYSIGTTPNINSGFPAYGAVLSGQTTMPTQGSSGGIVIGGDAQLYRGAANRLDLASGDSLNIVSGSVQIAGTNVIDSNMNWTGNTVWVSKGGTGATDATTARTNLGAAGTGNCAAGQVVMNTTSSGVQCVTVATGNVSGAGTATQVAYWSSSSALTSSSNLYWDNGNTRLGIGTNGPTQALDVRGHINVSGNVYYGGNLTGTGADFAERFTAAEELAAGEVVCLRADQKIEKCSERAQNTVVGIVSLKPTIIGNSQAPDSVAVGVVGIVPTKVSGKVSRGDLLTTSGKDGYAEKATSGDFGAIVGKAMESCGGGSCTIDVLVGLR